MKVMVTLTSMGMFKWIFKIRKRIVRKVKKVMMIKNKMTMIWMRKKWIQKMKMKAIKNVIMTTKMMIVRKMKRMDRLILSLLNRWRQNLKKGKKMMDRMKVLIMIVKIIMTSVKKVGLKQLISTNLRKQTKIQDKQSILDF